MIPMLLFAKKIKKQYQQILELKTSEGIEKFQELTDLNRPISYKYVFEIERS
ncbi:uncharacterized protein ASCRUDRAFT_77943 [Ascoidea rubescens DSM 1968]|uniref:Uncharacterized protein n=1 Tax=Ascoidea rubescens DSM 1968 TaxID=1344418 RepID=A0A1D2VA10_9ASCO|nr:hypothetical protein ASCRUDRAFT_77943 [Ascoidea rubescens DSM 1968]ODV58478.1 hypothetical protein ASCRUDRAFT_77943 [Ascoidea rubescens DSM 1968]